MEQLGRHLGTEVQLAKAEMSEKLARAEQGAVFLGLAAVLMIPALVVLLLTLALWLTDMGVPTVLSHLAAAAVGLVISGILGFTGLNRLNAKNLKPNRTIHQIDEDVAVARNLVK
jgi:uncharacterized membrane protein YqjE